MGLRKSKLLSIRILFVFILLSFQAKLQELSSLDMINQRIEFVLESGQDDNIDLTNLFSSLTNYLKHPLNLNLASENELQQLMLLNDFQISALINHRIVNGKLISIYEVQAIEHWDNQTIEIILPFVTVDDKLEQPLLTKATLLKESEAVLISRYQQNLESKKGYSIQDTSASRYLGNSSGLYERFRLSYRTNFSLGFTMEKDPGEVLSNKGFDFNSAHLYFQGGKYLKSFAVGDYQVEIGQGVNFWTGYAFGKSADILQIKKSATPIRPYTSADESRFMRGGAVHLNYRKFNLLTFYSSKQIDASLQFDTLIDFYSSSITQNGLHRTASELQRKHQVNEQVLGSSLNYKSRNFEVGVSAVQQSYNQPLLKDTLPYNQFDFRGTNLLNTSLYYNWMFQNIVLFGEIVPKKDLTKAALLQGLLISLDKTSSLTFLYRSYGIGYHSFYNNAFANGSKVQNEQGFFVGYNKSISKYWQLNAYVDLVNYPWLKYQVDQPSKGADYLIQLTYRPTKQLEFYARFRTRIQEKNQASTTNSIDILESNNRKNIRFHLSYKLSDEVSLKSRVEIVDLNNSEKGMLMYQDIVWKSTHPLKVSMRFAFFQSDNYDTRIYTYESNVLGVYSVPSFYNKGSRVYGMLNYTFFRRLDCWLRIGRTIYDDQTTIGSGLEEITGNKKTEIVFQLRFEM